MKAKDRFWLFAISPCFFPAIIKQDWNDVDSSAFGYSQEGENILDVLIFAFDVWSDVQEDSKFGKAQLSTPSQLTIYGIQVQLFPHFDLIISVGRDIIGSSAPLVSIIPVKCFLFSPPSIHCSHYCHQHHKHKQCCPSHIDYLLDIAQQHAKDSNKPLFFSLQFFIMTYLLSQYLCIWVYVGVFWMIVLINQMREDEALIEQLCARFQKRPRKCRKINDSNIGSAERIVCINSKTFYYYPKIQEFQDLDFDKLQYVVPKAGVKLNDILELKFPPRRENQRNFFSITLPKNRILKFTKTLKELIVDELAEGEQEWTFYFDYDIVALPVKERKAREAKLKQAEKERQGRAELQRLKEKEEREKVEKINEEINSLNQAEELRSGGSENEEYLRKKQQLTEREETHKRILQSDELFFHYHYRKLLEKMPEKVCAEQQLVLLQQIGKFRQRAEQAVREFVDELAFAPIKLRNGYYYLKNNLRIKFGEKNLNQQFLANYQISDALYSAREQTRGWELRVPLKAFVKYKGFKAIVVALTPLDGLAEQAFDDAIVHGHSVDNWKIHFMLVEALTLVLGKMHLKPYFSEVHYQKVQIHMGANLKILQTTNDPFAPVKQLDPPSFSQPNNYKINYLYEIDEVFPIDLDINRSINQENVRLRPEYLRKFVKMGVGVSHLSAGSLTYSFDDEEGEKEDLAVAKASQMLKMQEIVRFVQRLDTLEVVVEDSAHLSAVMKRNGINMRYLGRIIKITRLPYIKAMAEVDAIARTIRQLYCDHQRQFVTDLFRAREEVQHYSREAFHPRTKPNMSKIRIKQLRQEEEKHSKINAVDFLNLIFGSSPDFVPFWQIISARVAATYEFDMKDPQDYPHGYLLKAVLYHCELKINISDKLKLFQSAHPFSLDDGVQFVVRSRAYDFPSMSLYQIASTEGIAADQIQRLLPRLELQLQIRRALHAPEAPVLLQLSKFTPKIGPPTDKYTLESFMYYLYHPSPDNFEPAHKIAQLVFPTSHPLIMQLYLQYAKLKDLDPVTLKRAAENHAIRNLGISHWKTAQILSNFKEIEYINHLIRAEAGVEEAKRSDLYLSIVRELARYGKLHQSLIYVHRSISHFDRLTTLIPHQQENYFEILLQGIENHYVTRTIEDLLKLSETSYNALTRYDVPFDSKWFYWLLYYTLKGFLESSRKKYYLFKLILVFKERNRSSQSLPAGNERAELFRELGVKWRDSRNHINHIKQMLIKLEFGFTEINYLPDFFVEFQHHVERLRNEDFNEGLKEYNDLFLIFGFTYFEEALLQNVFAFQKAREAEKEAAH